MIPVCLECGQEPRVEKASDKFFVICGTPTSTDRCGFRVLSDGKGTEQAAIEDYVKATEFQRRLRGLPA